MSDIATKSKIIDKHLCSVNIIGKYTNLIVNGDTYIKGDLNVDSIHCLGKTNLITKDKLRGKNDQLVRVTKDNISHIMRLDEVSYESDMIIEYF